MLFPRIYWRQTMRDSGASDSEFFKIQKLLRKKNSDWIKKAEEEADRDALIARFSRSKEPKKTLWQKIKGWW